MTWTEWAVLLLITERVYIGARAAYRAMTPQPAAPDPSAAFRRVYDFRPVPVDDHAALDYSSGSKRH